jgi:hypothetical protein
VKSFHASIIAIVFVSCPILVHTASEDAPIHVDQEWRQGGWIPCAGAGVFGTFTLKASMTLVHSESDPPTKITSLSIRVSSPLFTRRDIAKDFTAEVEVVDSTQHVIRSMTLSRPDRPSVEDVQMPDETERKYLRDDPGLSVPAGGSVRFTVTPAIGNCALGTMTARYAPPQSPQAPINLRISP